MALHFRRRLSLAIHRALGVQLRVMSKPAHRYCTGTIDEQLVPWNLESEDTNEQDRLSTRIERLSRGEPVGSVFQRWMGDGFPVHRGEIFHAINRLRKLKLNKRALEVMEWVIRERPYKPRELDYSYLLEFTVKLHGISRGEQLFTHVPLEFQNDLLYNNLVIACLDKGMVQLSLDYMKKMREHGHPISHLIFNRLIIIHSSSSPPSSRKKTIIIPKILRQMKADKVSPHVSTYNILLKIEADEHNIEGLLRVFAEMKQRSSEVEPNEITFCILATAHAIARLYTVCEAYVECIEKSMTGNNWSTFDVLLILYGCLGKVTDLERTWGVVQALPRPRPRPRPRSKSFLLAIEAFSRVGLMSRAEEIWEELKKTTRGGTLKSADMFNSMISAYCRSGSVDKVSNLVREMKSNGCKPNAITYRHLALGCLKAGLVQQGLKTLRLGLMKQKVISKVKKSTPWLETTLSIVELLADMGDVENVEKLFEELKIANYTRHAFVYNTLVKAYVKAKVYCPDLLTRMILGGARPDAETYSLIKLVEQFKT